ncbi:MAG: sensor histidine kinase, partial [Parafannyhessea sp.]|uniref:sensor histidine kinase n=1 Tax=Parafannyhessea sp. TaxID=2847324 RepID=UPI003EFC8A00
MRVRQRVARLSRGERTSLEVLWGLLALAAYADVAFVVLALPSLGGVLLPWGIACCAVSLVALAGVAALALRQLEARALRRAGEKDERAMREFQLKEREQRHDLNIHLMAVAGMLDAGRYDECRAYLRDMLDASQSVAQLMPFDDPAVSALLNQLYGTAKERGVTLAVTAYDDLSRIGCEAYELIQIMGNLVRNAIEAAEGLPEGRRRVEVVTLSRRGRCIIRVENDLPEGAVVDDRVFEL